MTLVKHKHEHKYLVQHDVDEDQHARAPDAGRAVHQQRRPRVLLLQLHDLDRRRARGRMKEQQAVRANGGGEGQIKRHVVVCIHRRMHEDETTEKDACTHTTRHTFVT